jgi:hypothetical protein
MRTRRGVSLVEAYLGCCPAYGHEGWKCHDGFLLVVDAEAGKGYPKDGPEVCAP